MSDLVERLRNLGEYAGTYGKAIGQEAADEIERLRAALKVALDAIESVVDDAAFGVGGSNEGTRWYIKDELLHNIRAALGGEDAD